MAIKSDDVVRLIIGLIWPLVVLLLAVLFRRPLTAFLEGIAGLVRGGLSKVSLPGGFAFELVKTTEFKVDWSGPGGQDLRNTVAIGQFASGVQDMLGLLKPQQTSPLADYAVFDLGCGDRWLTSRLHLFCLLLRRMHGLRYCVFVYDSADMRRRWLGCASTEAVRWALALNYPHLERSAHQASLGLKDANFQPSDERITSHTGALDPQLAISFINNYLGAIQVDLQFSNANLTNEVEGLARELLQGAGLAAFLRSQLPGPALNELNAAPRWTYEVSAVANAIDDLMQNESFYEESRFAGIQLSDEAKKLAGMKPDGDDRTLLNRLLLYEAFPKFIQPFTVPAGFVSFNDGGWVKLDTRDASGVLRTRWERAEWLGSTSTEELLDPDLIRAMVSMESLQGVPRKEQVSMILRADAPMVAVVGDGARFERLIDRMALAARAIEPTL
jgi:hypothetical protein